MDIIKNRKAFFDYEMLETYDAGIVLKGTEVKSLRVNGASISESFCYFNNGELFLKGSHIAKYKYNGYVNHEETADRKLLLTKNQLLKIKQATQNKGLTIIPTKMYFNKRGICKVEIAIARGKKKYDKRETIKNRDLDRQMKSEI